MVAKITGSMFAESLLESGNVHPKGRGWATTLSVAIQIVLLGVLVALPMLRPDALPLTIKSLTSPVAFGRPDAPPDPHPGPKPSTGKSKLIAPADIPADRPTGSQDKRDEALPSCMPFCGAGPIGDKNGVMGMPRIPMPMTPIVVPVKPPERVIVSQIELGSVISRTQPVYPPMAIQTRTEGTVLLRAVIDRTGRISHVQVLSGPALLQHAARNAVEQWRYRPYVLNGQTVEVETHITVNFRLGQR
jgi:periplasmic protein TonB